MKPLEEKVNPKHAALLVVDVQNDFCHEQGAKGRRGRDLSDTHAMVPRLLRLIDEARRVGLTIIHIRLANSEGTVSPVWQEAQSKLPGGREHPTCIEGTWGAEFYQVVPQPGEYVITKRRHSAFVGTDLDMILRVGGIQSLILTGVSTNICVESTARDGFMRDYYVVFLEDCTAGTSLEDHQATLSNIHRFYGVVTTSEEVIKAWARLGQRAKVRAS